MHRNALGVHYYAPREGAVSLVHLRTSPYPVNGSFNYRNLMGLMARFCRVETSARNPRELADSRPTVRGPRRAREGYVANRAAASWRGTNLARATAQGVRANSRAPGGARARPKSVARVVRNDAAAIAAPRARVVVLRALWRAWKVRSARTHFIATVLLITVRRLVFVA